MILYAKPKIVAAQLQNAELLATAVFLPIVHKRRLTTTVQHLAITAVAAERGAFSGLASNFLALSPIELFL
jgi:hypothetical protein